SREDIVYTAGLGYTIKLLAIAKQTKNGVDLRVHPTLVADRHLLASVDGVFNAIYVEGDYSEQQIFQGKGAGESPTGSAVVADLIDAAKEILSGNSIRAGRIAVENKLKLAPFGDVECRHYIRIPAVDQPGVLARIAKIMGDGGISIASVIQRGKRKKGVVPVVLMTDKARESAMAKALSQIRRLAAVKSSPLRIRVEG
ncbi:MAG: ACT domain-containing protein, partial [Candidatus Auribacterota bacterium]|nr:ACT domain-containing protein [Candidatus Auribacterota bacterium]